MDWKEFLKPKIITLILFLILFLVLPNFTSNCTDCQALITAEGTTRSCNCEMIFTFFAGYLMTSNFMIYKNFISNIISAGSILSIFLQLIISYFISCTIIYLIKSKK